MPIAVEEDRVDNSDLTTRERISLLKEKAKVKSKQALHIGRHAVEDEQDTIDYDAALAEIDDSPAFNPSNFLNRKRIGPAGYPDKVIAVLQGAAETILHPKTTIKEKATKTTASKLAKSGPYLSRQADLDFLEAYDDLQRVRENRNGSDDEETAARKDGDINNATERIEDMEQRRQSMRVAWVTVSHVQRVRVVDDKAPSFPNDAFFEEVDDCGFTTFNWSKWIVFKLIHITHSFTAQYIDDFDELPLDVDTLRRHVERFIIVSAPLQLFLADLRRIYTWHDPARTGKWLALYCFLWYISHIMTFVYGYIFYKTIMNYYYPTSVKTLREGIERTIDRGATALKIGELMDKHGSDDWLAPLVDEIGPHIQANIADFNSLLEAGYNFFHWRTPIHTRHSLFLFATLFCICALGDSKFVMKIFWLTVGFMFFGCWPFATLYPRYRVIGSIWKWGIWDVPNHSEWALQYLRIRATIAKETIIAHEIDDSHFVRTGLSVDAYDDVNSDAESFHSASEVPATEEERDIMSFGCSYESTPGRLIISTHGIRFKSGVGVSSSSFRRPYSSLIEMTKRQTPSSILSPLGKITLGLDKLELRFRRTNSRAAIQDLGQEEHVDIMTLENMRGRDKAFNAIIGFSDLRWQHLQKKPEPKKEKKKKEAGRHAVMTTK